jgi:membrane fusion protein (multidrug efflux system)
MKAKTQTLFHADSLCSLALRRAFPATVLFSTLALLAACSRSPAAPGTKAGGPGGPPGPTAVGVITLSPQSVALTKELPGRTSPYRVAEVRARVSGIVLKRNFVEGAEVKEGQVLFEIDAAPYRAAFDSAKATLARAEGNLISARAQADRYQALIEAKAISQQDYDNAHATFLASDADVAAGRAAVETANINLGYTSVTSPITGRIGRSSVTEGALVQAGQATLLAVVQQIDPIYVDLSQSSDEWLRFKDEIASGKLRAEADGGTKVTLITGAGRDYPQPGRLQFSDITVDQSTGSIAVRAVFPNPNQDLLPGMFVRARIVEGVNPAALLVPQGAVTRDSRGTATALIVNAQNKAEVRPVVVSRTVGASWLIASGLAAGDRVIVEGLQRLRPGADVKAEAVVAPAPTVVAAAANR